MTRATGSWISNEDGDEASKKRSFKKIANTEPDLLHFPGTSESTQLYTLYALAPVNNSLPQKKILWSSQCQSSDKENRVSNVNMGLKAVTALSFERKVPGNVSTTAAVMKIFLMSQNSDDLEKQTITKFAIMWDAMKKIHEPLVIEGSTEANNQLVEIIRKKQSDKQLPHASDHPFANSRGSNNGIGMSNSWVPSTTGNANRISSQTRQNIPTRLHQR